MVMKNIYFVLLITFFDGCIFTPSSEIIQAKGLDATFFDRSPILQVAKRQIGVPYRYGGNTPYEGFDCSGFVSYVYKNALGVKLPRRSIDQSKVGRVVSLSNLKAGDLLFFDTAKRGHINHTGIYIGNGKFIHASSGRVRGVTISDLKRGFYKRCFRVAKRI